MGDNIAFRTKKTVKAMSIGGCFCQLVGNFLCGGGWWWIYFGWWWVLVDGGEYILAGGGWWWMMGDGDGWWHELT